MLTQASIEVNISRGYNYVSVNILATIHESLYIHISTLPVDTYLYAVLKFAKLWLRR
jgi:hypothetical protein